MTWFIFNQNNNLLLLQSAEGDFFLPECESGDLPVALADEVHRFDFTDVCGASACAMGIEGDEPTFGLPTAKVTAEGLLDASETTVQTEVRVCGYKWVPLRQSWEVLSHADYKWAARASVLITWDRSNRFCPICGAPLERISYMGKKCTQCGRQHFPHIAPASIVRVLRDDKILLVKAKTFKRDMHGLVAGFLEGGETFEECAAREVKEETGLTIKNVRYFASQSWPYPSGVMVGFTADYESGDIVLADGELQHADFYGRDELPNIPTKISIARQLIDDWLER